MDRFTVELTGKEIAAMKVTLETAIPGMRAIADHFAGMGEPFSVADAMLEEIDTFAGIVAKLTAACPDVGPHIGALSHVMDGEWRFRHERDDDDADG